jgi:hypothetical protein
MDGGLMPNAARSLRVAGVLFVAVAAGSVEIGCGNQPAGKPAASPPASQTAAPTPASPPTAPADPLAIDPSQVSPNDAGEPVRTGADFPVTTPFARDTRTFRIAPLDGVEFNYRMEKGGTMVYSWKASDFVVWDFHGEPKGSKPGYAESYGMGEGKEGNGGFIAPTSGIHGWFWENQGAKAVTVTLTTAGHYSEGLLTMPDDSRAPKPLNPR